MGISDWFYYSLSCLDYTLFYIGLHRPKTAKLVVVGLENAGKSSLLQNLANRPPGFAVDTSHPGLETLVRGSISFTALDVGGHHQNRELWTKTICGASAVVFMVDAQDAERFDEAAAELHAFSAAKELKGVPSVVLANKFDHPCAITSAKGIWDRLRAHEITSRPIPLFMCSVATRRGYGEGIRWLADKLRV